MKRQTIGIAVAACLVVGGAALAPAAHAQQPPTTPAGTKALPPISLDLRDAPIRQALEQLFTSAGVQYGIDPGVAGFITLKIFDQPFDTALRLLMRASSVPLTYTLEGGVYLVKVRPLVTTDPASLAPPPDPTTLTQQRQRLPLEQIQLTYMDPADLSGLLGVQILPNLIRGQRMGGGGGMGGGMMGGGMGGMGGGMMGGGMGGMGGGFGGMGGGMGGMGGGMMGGGMGGMGGGMMGGGMGGGMMGGMGGGMGGGFR